MRFAVMTLFSGLAWAQMSSMAPINPGTVQEPAKVVSSAQQQEDPVDANTLLPPLPAVPSGKATLVGGTVSGLDRVRDQFVIRPFGGSSMKVLFDGRTQFWRDGAKASSRDLSNGQKVYVDTVSDGSSIFAKNIRLVSYGATGESRGQIVSFDRGRSELTLNDGLTPKPFRVRIMPRTKVVSDGRETSTNLLQPGTLVTVQFRPEGEGLVSAQQISILAAPGTSFTFIGHVIFLDFHQGLMVVMDPRDKKSYEVHFNPSSVRVNGDLQLDADVTVNAGFDGNRYATNAIQVNRPSDR
jgi:Domain of unknown function (DUF5666)